MFFKSDQANVNDARDAVKKQLLRTLIQQVVDELNSETGEGFEEAIAEFLSNEDLASAAGTIKHALSAGIRQQLFPGLVKEVMEEITPATDDLDELVSEHLEEEDTSQMREQFRAGFKRQLQEKIIPASIRAAVAEAATDESGEVEAMVSDAMQQVDVTELSAAIQAAIQLRVQGLIPDVVHQEVASSIDSTTDGIQERIADAVAAADADALIGRLRLLASEAFEARLQQEISDELTSPSKSMHQHLEQLVSQRFEDFLVSSDWANGLKAAEDSVLQQVKQAIEETMTGDELLQERLNEAIEERIATNDALRSQLEENARKALVSSLSDQLSINLAGSSQLVNETAQAITDQAEIMATLESSIHAELKERIMTAAMGQLANESADKARAWVQTDHPAVRDAVADVLDHVISMVRAQAQKEASDTQTVVGNVLPSFSAETDVIKASIRETRNRLIERVAQFSVRKMEDSSRVAAEASKRIADENERMLSAVQSSPRSAY